MESPPLVPSKRDLPKYVICDVDKKGAARYYFRPPGRAKTRIHAVPGTQGFDRLVDELMSAASLTDRASVPKQFNFPRSETFGWLVRQYLTKANSPFRENTDRVARRTIEQVLLQCMDEPIAPGSKDKIGDVPLQHVTSKVIRVLRDRKVGLPGAANKRLKILSPVFGWAIEQELSEFITSNPVRDVKKMPKKHTNGFHAWTLAEIEIFEERHPIGTAARLALALLLYTGQRRSDVVRLGPPMARDGWLHFTQHKNRASKPNHMEIPIVPQLQMIIDASEIGNETYLVTTFGKPFVSNGFGNKMRKWCDEAGLPKCSCHGLRKAAAARLAELDCTDREIMAITGHRTASEVDRYTRSARRRKLAMSVLKKNDVHNSAGRRSIDPET